MTLAADADRGDGAARCALACYDIGAVLSLDRLAAGHPAVRKVTTPAGTCLLPRQLVHGDIGPDNVLLDGERVVAIIDFRPHVLPVLSAASTAPYWYHVYGQRAVSAAGRAPIPGRLREPGWPRSRPSPPLSAVPSPLRTSPDL